MKLIKITSIICISLLLLLNIMGCSASNNSDDTANLIDFSSEADKFNVEKLFTNDPVYVEKGSFLDESWKRTLSFTYTLYYGELSDNSPSGKGILLISTEDSKDLVVGNFKNGKINGFATVYSLLARYGADDYNYYDFFVKSYQGYFQNGEYHGKGNWFDRGYEVLSMDMDSGIDIDEIINDEINNNGGLLIEKSNYSKTNILLLDGESYYETSNYYTGEFAKGKSNGEGKAYLSNTLYYEGSFKNGVYDGKGTLYYSDGSVKYKGDFKNDRYNGNGILYDSNGNVIHKGKFKNGDIA